MACAASSRARSRRPRWPRSPSMLARTACLSSARWRRSEMKLSQELEVTIQVAFSESDRRGHSLATLGHLLYALLHDEETRETLRHAGADVEKLKKALDRFLEREVPKRPTGLASDV